jgi:hypothetical protein
MDVETSGAIEQLGRRIDALEGSLRGEFGLLRGEFGSLRSEVRAGLEENRRHAEVLIESLRDDIRMLAEGFATLTAKLDSRHG